MPAQPELHHRAGGDLYFRQRPCAVTPPGASSEGRMILTRS
jgi:hypothetical protein